MQNLFPELLTYSSHKCTNKQQKRINTRHELSSSLFKQKCGAGLERQNWKITTKVIYVDACFQQQTETEWPSDLIGSMCNFLQLSCLKPQLVLGTRHTNDHLGLHGERTTAQKRESSRLPSDLIVLAGG